MKLIKGFLLIAGIVALLLLAYLTLPGDLLHKSGGPTVNQKVAYVKNSRNGGVACEANITYIAEDSRRWHENEGYPFVVNTDCADLQKSLVEAIRNRDVETVKKLISWGASAAAVDRSKIDSVIPISAASIDDLEMLRLLLENGADVNKEFCCCAYCDTLLVRAIRSNQPATVELLINRGANPNYRPSFSDGELLSPCELAEASENTDIMDTMDSVCDRDIRHRISSRFVRLEKVFGIK